VAFSFYLPVFPPGSIQNRTYLSQGKATSPETFPRTKNSLKEEEEEEEEELTLMCH